MRYAPNEVNGSHVRHGQPWTTGRSAQAIDGSRDLDGRTAWTAFRPAILHMGSSAPLRQAWLPGRSANAVRLLLTPPYYIKESRPAVQAVQISISMRVSARFRSRPASSNVDHFAQGPRESFGIIRTPGGRNCLLTGFGNFAFLAWRRSAAGSRQSEVARRDRCVVTHAFEARWLHLVAGNDGAIQLMSGNPMFGHNCSGATRSVHKATPDNVSRIR